MSQRLRNHNDLFQTESDVGWGKSFDMAHGTATTHSRKKSKQTFLLAQWINWFKWQTTNCTAMQTTLSLDVKIQFLQSAFEIQIEWHLRLALTEWVRLKNKSVRRLVKNSSVFPIAAATAATFRLGRLSLTDARCRVLFITFIDVAIDDGDDDAMVQLWERKKSVNYYDNNWSVLDATWHRRT